MHELIMVGKFNNLAVEQSQVLEVEEWIKRILFVWSCRKPLVHGQNGFHDVQSEVCPVIVDPLLVLRFGGRDVAGLLTLFYGIDEQWKHSRFQQYEIIVACSPNELSAEPYGQRLLNITGVFILQCLENLLDCSLDRWSIFRDSAYMFSCSIRSCTKP